MHKIKKTICGIMALAVIMSAFGNPIVVNAQEKWRYTIGTSGFQKQEGTSWCWVASARNMAVSKVTKVNVTKSQQTVVKEVLGKVLYTWGGNPQNISKATKKFNKSCKSSCKASCLSFAKFKEKIKKGGGLVLATYHPLHGGHAILVYGYSSEGRVKIFDPMIGSFSCKYKSLKDGTGLDGYIYEETVFY